MNEHIKEYWWVYLFILAWFVIMGSLITLATTKDKVSAIEEYFCESNGGEYYVKKISQTFSTCIIDYSKWEIVKIEEEYRLIK